MHVFARVCMRVLVCAGVCSVLHVVDCCVGFARVCLLLMLFACVCLVLFVLVCC